MSELTTALKVIFSWLKENYSKFEQSFNAGLNYMEKFYQLIQIKFVINVEAKKIKMIAYI